MVGEGLATDDRALVERAWARASTVYADRRLGTGEPVSGHAEAVETALGELRLDAATRAAGLLFAVPEYVKGYRDELVASFGEEIASLVAGIARLHELRLLTRGVAAQEAGSGKSEQAEVLRKMLLAMVEDIRAVLVRLASRTQTLRYLTRIETPARRAIAQETMDIYAPLANRLGVWQLKWELEDLSFRFLDPEAYKRIARMVDERRTEREAFIGDSIDTLGRELAAAGIRAEISGRPKHIYSIHTKMRLKERDFADLYDVRALRVLVADVRDCYSALGVVHNLWTPIPKEFDDYISRPKPNGYRSLHTAVVGADGRALEVQIRTHAMHHDSELGVAAHWRYKETAGSEPARRSTYEERIAQLRGILAWRDEVVNRSEWVERIKQAARDEDIYVLTPQGRVIELPRGATPIDFAYHVHTDLGHRCRGAKVNGAMVPLNHRLENGERVEIVAAKQGGPSRDWLNAELGFLQSHRARTKVRQWFNAIEEAQTAQSGRALVERELQREGRTGANLEQLAARLGFGKPEELFVAVGREEVGPNQLRLAIRGESAAAPPPADEARLAKPAGGGKAGQGILVVGVDRLMTQLAKCCRPIPPDSIGGFVTRGRGISVHRRNCASYAALLKGEPERRIDAHWGEATQGVFAVDIVVEANDRQGLLRDVSEALARDRINVTAVNTLSRKSVATMQFTVEVRDAVHLAEALAHVREVPGVYVAGRRN